MVCQNVCLTTESERTVLAIYIASCDFKVQSPSDPVQYQLVLFIPSEYLLTLQMTKEGFLWYSACDLSIA